MAGRPHAALTLAAMLWAAWPTASAATSAEWIEGYEAGLAEAQRQQRPAFIYFDAGWCSWCQRYKRETLGDARVRERLARDYVAVRVDFDARPDLAQRYRVRGLPYTLILSPRGEFRNGFVGILTPADMQDLLRQFAVASKPAATGELSEIVARAGRTDREGFERFRRAFLDHVEGLYDRRGGTLSGRFETGVTLKRPSPLTWMYLGNDERWRERARRAARAEVRRLHDPVDGGFFNFLDPSLPAGDYTESSKLLEGNAWLTAWFMQAGVEDAELRRAAQSGWRFLRQRLWNGHGGGFWQAQVADQRYYALSPTQRRRAEPPPLDRMKRTDTNAQAAFALVRFTEAGGERRALEYAAGALDFVLATLWRDGRLYHHWRDNKLSTPNLPHDWFWVLAAGAELERVRPDSKRRAQLQKIAVTAAAWLRREMRDTKAELPDPELAALIGWVAQQRELYPSLSPARDWALARLHLRADTRPDDVVLGLMAWERALGNF